MEPVDPHNRKQPDRLHQQLDEAERGLLRVHKALLDHERARYERARRRIGGPGDFLQLVIHDPWFAWLRPISQLAAQIDEFVGSKRPTDPRQGEALLARARTLLSPSESGDDFQRQYQRSIQESPEVAMLHANWKQSAIAEDRR